MMLNLPREYKLSDLVHWVAANKPSHIGMTRMQRKYYLRMVNQQLADRPLKFMRVPIIVVD